MAPEMNDDIMIIPVAPISDGAEAAAENTTTTSSITIFLRRWTAAEARSGVRTLLLQFVTVVIMVQEHKLGKLVFNLGAAATLGLIISTFGGGNSVTRCGYLVVVGLSLGCGLILEGMLLRAAFPRAAEVMEHGGIALVMTSFYALVASALPMEIGWVLVLTAAFCAFTLIIPVLPHRNTTPAADQINTPPDI